MGFFLLETDKNCQQQGSYSFRNESFISSPNQYLLFQLSWQGGNCAVSWRRGGVDEQYNSNRSIDPELQNLGHAAHNYAALYCGWGMWYTFFSLDLTKTKKSFLQGNSPVTMTPTHTHTAAIATVIAIAHTPKPFNQDHCCLCLFYDYVKARQR